MANNYVEVTTPGWEAAVYQVMLTPPTFCGVPMEFFVADFLGSLFLAPLWWPALVVGVLLYGIAWIGTQIEERWLEMFFEYITYRTYYEG